MKKIDEAISRIRSLECPTGDVEKSVALILEDYGVAASNEVKIDKDLSLNRDEAEAYRVKIESEGLSFVVLAKSEDDDYVAKVVDVLS